MTGKFADVIEDFAKDSVKENEGVWMPWKRHEFKIARAHRDNTAFLKLMEERMRPYQYMIDRGNFGALREIAADVMQSVYADTVLKGIRKIDTKEPLDYTAADGASLFKQLPDLWDAVFKFSGSDDNYSPDQVKADSGN